jgi:Na+-translocating ferredoxin:NAD+ oxidoreductase subunit E
MSAHEDRFNGLLGPLSLTPLLGASDSLVRAFSLLVLLWLIGGLHLGLIRPLRPRLSAGAHLLASALLAALLVSCVELILQAYALALYQALGVYLALIAIHCVLNESGHGSRQDFPKLIALFSLLMLALGLLRELLGNGTLLSNAQWLFGPGAASWQVNLLASGLHLALVTPGALILLGLLLAARNAWRHRSYPASKETLRP